MLIDDARTLFERYRDTLRSLGVTFPDGGGGGAAGLGDALHGIWHGAKEALRQATYWQMKNRAGVVGKAGLGPVLGRLPAPGSGCTWSGTASAPAWCRTRWPACRTGRRR